MLSINKHVYLTKRTLMKTADFDVPEHYFLDGHITSFFHMTGNET